MECQRSFRGFRSRNGSKVPNFSPKRATKEYKYEMSGPRRRRGEPGEGFGKKTARTAFSSTPNIRKLIFWPAELEQIHFWRSGRDDKHMMKTVGKYLRLHSVWSVTTPHLSYRTSSYMNFFWTQCNFIFVFRDVPSS